MKANSLPFIAATTLRELGREAKDAGIENLNQLACAFFETRESTAIKINGIIKILRMNGFSYVPDLATISPELAGKIVEEFQNQQSELAGGDEG